MVPADDSTLGRLTYNGTEGFLGCPTKGIKGQYKVFVNVGSLNNDDVPRECFKECIDFVAATTRRLEDEPAAWEYD